ncbi:MAG: acetyl-CoA hydrolase, partial [Mycobacteriales bacterium]
MSASLDLARWIRPGDTLTWGQSCAEPSTLVEKLTDQADRLGALRCFVGIPAKSALTAETVPHRLEVHSYCGAGTNARLHRAGRLEVWPVHYSLFPDLLSAGGGLAADVVLVQVSPPDEEGRHSLGLGDDYFSAAIDT